MSRKEKEKEEITAESRLAAEIGSDTTDLVKGKVDMRRFSKLTPLDKAWISFFLLVDDEEGGEYFRDFCNNFLNLAPSEEGWRTNKAIQMVAASKGTAGVGAELVKRPSWVGRNVTNRGWKKEADEKGATVVE